MIGHFVEAGPASQDGLFTSIECFAASIPGSGMGLYGWFHGYFIASSLMGSLNYCKLNLRKGMSMTRLPLTIWVSFYTYDIGIVLSQFCLAALLFFDRSFGNSSFLIFILQVKVCITKEDHLYCLSIYFGSHPEVYIVLLPALE
jgi:cytochrome c oxidase subunit 1